MALRGPLVVPGIKPGLATYDASALLSLSGPSISNLLSREKYLLNRIASVFKLGSVVILLCNFVGGEG